MSNEMVSNMLARVVLDELKIRGWTLTGAIVSKVENGKRKTLYLPVGSVATAEYHIGIAEKLGLTDQDYLDTGIIPEPKEWETI